MGSLCDNAKCCKRVTQTPGILVIGAPTLVLHGDDDQIVPIGASALMSSKIVKNATLKVYPGFPHGMPTTNADQINADLLAFIKHSQAVAA